ncbi:MULTISPECIES: glycoside hydrolase family 16 protein [unclassified Blastococcus]
MASTLLLVGGVGGCGEDRPDGKRLLWADEFDGPAGALPDPEVWTPELGGGGWGNDELQTYTGDPLNVALDGDGHLQLTARATGPDDDRRWTSARITTFGAQTFFEGRIEVRAQVPSGAGIWPAAWTLGQDIQQVGWPACGEIDLIESIGDAREALQTVHGPRPDGTNWLKTIATPVDDPLSEDFHVYGADWSSDRITFFIDDQVTGTVTRDDVPEGAAWPFDSPHYVLLNVAVGGRLPGPPDASTPQKATMLVDWVRVYEPD